MEWLLAPEVRPFAIALAILLGLLLIEVVSMFGGLSAGSVLDKALEGDGDGDGWLAGALGWLNVGRVPVMVLLWPAPMRAMAKRAGAMVPKSSPSSSCAWSISATS